MTTPSAAERAADSITADVFGITLSKKEFRERVLKHITTETGDGEDKARVDLLELLYVEVRRPLVYGSREMFFCSPTDNEGPEEIPSDLRKRIDAERKKGTV